jgi:hypothetical protein
MLPPFLACVGACPCCDRVSADDENLDVTDPSPLTRSLRTPPAAVMADPLAPSESRDSKYLTCSKSRCRRATRTSWSVSPVLLHRLCVCVCVEREREREREGEAGERKRAGERESARARGMGGGGGGETWLRWRDCFLSQSVIPHPQAVLQASSC